MNIVVDLVILASAVTCAAYASAIHKRMGEANQSFHRLLLFLDGAHGEHRRDLLSEQVVSGAFQKTLTDAVRGCRDSIDAIRSATDELSAHRRETVEVRAPSVSGDFPAPERPATIKAALPVAAIPEEDQKGDRDSADLLTRVVPKPTAAELAGPAQVAAGLSRPKSPRQTPPRAVRTDPPPRAQTMVGMATPGGPYSLPAVAPPPIARPRSPATLPSMIAVEAPGAAPAPSSASQHKKAICSGCASGHVRLPGGTIADCEVCGGSGFVLVGQRSSEARS